MANAERCSPRLCWNIWICFLNSVSGIVPVVCVNGAVLFYSGTLDADRS